MINAFDIVRENNFIVLPQAGTSFIPGLRIKAIFY